MVKSELLALLKAERPRRRFRNQTGSVVKRFDGFYIRYYKDSDGGIRTKVTERLCDLSVVDPQKRKLLAKSHMSAINNLHHAALRSDAPTPVLTIGAFWDTIYRPWVEKNKRASTLRGYEYVWRLYVKAELAHRPVDSYHTIDASEFLTRLTEKLNGKSLSHVRALMSGIFAHAVNTKGANGKALIDKNPIRDVKVLANLRESKERVAYTPEETIAIINANHPPPQFYSGICDFRHTVRVGSRFIPLTMPKRHKKDLELLDNARMVVLRSKELIEQTRELLVQSSILVNGGRITPPSWKEPNSSD